MPGSLLATIGGRAYRAAAVGRVIMEIQDISETTTNIYGPQIQKCRSTTFEDLLAYFSFAPFMSVLLLS